MFHQADGDDQDCEAGAAGIGVVWNLHKDIRNRLVLYVFFVRCFWRTEGEPAG